MEIFNFTDFDPKYLDKKKKDYFFSVKLISLVYIYFILKFTIKYGYINLLPSFIAFYILMIVAYPVTKKITKNYYKSIFSFYFVFLSNISYFMLLSGGIKAPGVMWFAITPFLGASLLGKRGYFWGVSYTIFTVILFLIFSYFDISYYPFQSIDSYFFEFRVNFFLFVLSSSYITYYYVKSESDFQEKINLETEKTENLLRILFHDLSNPMQTTRLLVKKIKSNRTPEDHDKIIDQIDKTSFQIVEVLDHVRKIKALEDSKITLEMKPYIIHDALSKTQEIFETKLNDKNIKLKIENPESDLAVVLVDQIYFTHQILGNIISNSIKFSDPGSEINITWKKVDNYMQIKIIDQGIGIPKEILDNLFTVKKHRSRNGTYGEIGTGYGMPLVKTIVEQFKGKIEISSTEKVGTTIIIKLPSV